MAKNVPLVNADFMQDYQPDRLPDGSKPIHHTEMWYAEHGEATGEGFTAEFAETHNPQGWQFWALWQESDSQGQLWDPTNKIGFAKPECRYTATEHDRHVTGNRAFMWFTFMRIHDAGIYQRVDAESVQGHRVRFSTHVHAWCGSGNADESLPGKGALAYRASDLFAQYEAGEIDQQTYDDRRAFAFHLGIDPTGGTDPTADSVIWGEGWHVYNVYHEISIKADIPEDAETITLFISSRCLWPVTHNDAYVDAPRLLDLDADDEPDDPTPPAPLPDPTGQSKLGPHILAAAQGIEAWLDARPTVAKVAGHLGAADLVHEDTLLIGRVITNNIPGMFSDLPVDVARWLVNEQRAQYEANPSIQYWEGPNEFNPSTPHEMRWIAAMEAERVRLLADLGLKAVIFNFSTGCPTLDLWVHAGEALQAAADHGALLGLHEYSGGYMQWLTYDEQPPDGDAVNGGWLTLRYRLIHDRYLEPMGYGDLPIVITEAGLDTVAPTPPGCDQTGAWKDLADYWARAFGRDDPEAFYTEQLLWYEQQLRQDKYVIGATVFTLGGPGGWQRFDVAGEVAQRLADYRPPSDEPDEPEPQPGRGAPRTQYERAYVLMPPDSDVTWDAAAAIGAHPFGLTVGHSADDAGIGDLDTRRVLAVNPQRWPDSLADFFNTYYPGVTYVPVEARTPAELVVMLAPLLDIGEPEQLVVNQRAYANDLGEDPGGETIGTHGCLLSSLAMLLRKVYGRAVGPVELNEVFALLGDVYTSDDLLTQWQRVVEHFPVFDDAVKVNRRYTAAELAGLHAQGWEIILAVNGGAHFVYYLEPLSEHYVGVIDPWGGEVTQWRVSDVVGIRAAHVATGGATEPDPEPTPEPPRVSEVRGAHAAPVLTPPNPASVEIARCQALGLRWYKMLDGGDARNVIFAKSLKDAGIEPVVRLYCAEQAPRRLFDFKPGLKQRVSDYVHNGIEYFEILNEPNLAHEWRGDYQHRVTWQDAHLVEAVTEAWYADARTLIGLGGRAAFPAMAPTERDRGTHPQYSSWQWANRMLDLLVYRYKGQVTEWLRRNDLWLAVHTADFGRPFNYPPVTTDGLDDMCLLGYEPLRAQVAERFGVTPVTISTEGGVYSPSHLEDLGWPTTYTDEQWGERLRDMFAFLEQRGTLDAMLPWTWSDEGVSDERWLGCGWYDRHGNPRSPIDALRM